MRNLLVGISFFLILIVSPAQAWHHLPPGASAWKESGRMGIRGITIGPIESSQHPGRGYGTSYSAELLEELARLGVNWVSITPFGRISNLRSTRIQPDFEAPMIDSERGVELMISQARARGFDVLLVPHLWVESYEWRGQIDPGSSERWSAFLASYRVWLMRWARIAERSGATALSIGVECTSWSGRLFPFWLELIQEVRSVFSGALTYSANWDEVSNVVFWDQLDLIGVNAFHPLGQYSARSDQEYLMQARRNADELRRHAETLRMPVVFTELGYTSVANAAIRPWVWPEAMDDVMYDEREQERSFAATLGAFLSEPWFTGLFIWRYFSDLDDVSQEAIWGFSPHAKRAEKLIRQIFHSEWEVDPLPAVPTANRSELLRRQDAYPYTGLLPRSFGLSQFGFERDGSAAGSKP